MSTDNDERTVAVQQRWAAYGMWMLSIALAIDMMVRVLILKQQPRQYLDISLIWFAAILYTAIGTTASGVEPFEGKWSKAWLVILIIVVEVEVILALKGKVHTLADLMTGVINSAAGAFMMLLILRGIFSMWERRTLTRRPQRSNITWFQLKQELLARHA